MLDADNLKSRDGGRRGNSESLKAKDGRSTGPGAENVLGMPGLEAARSFLIAVASSDVDTWREGSC